MSSVVLKELHLPEFFAARRNQAGNGCQVRLNKNRSLVKIPQIKNKNKNGSECLFEIKFWNKAFKVATQPIENVFNAGAHVSKIRPQLK